MTVHQVYYDPLLSKLIVRGEDRTSALRALRKALNEYQVVGPSTNLEFLGRLAANEAFVRGEVETGFIQVRLALLSWSRGSSNFRGLGPPTETLRRALPAASGPLPLNFGDFGTLPCEA